MNARPREELPIYLRVYTRPVEGKIPAKGTHDPPNEHLVIALDVETKTDTTQAPRFGLARVYVDGAQTNSFVFYAEVTNEERGVIERWAAARGATPMPLFRFVTTIYLPFAIERRAVVLGFNLPFDLSRICADFRPKMRLKNKRAWTLCPIPRTNPRYPYVPRTRVEHIGPHKAFINFTSVIGRSYRGAFVDVQTFCAALTGEGGSLRSMGVAFGCSLHKTETDYRGPVTPEYLDYCLNDVDLTVELYSKARERYAEFGLPLHPSRIFSSASLAKDALRERGVEPPAVDDPLLLGRVMAAFMAGKVECRIVAREVRDVTDLDYSGQYPLLYCLLGAERWMTARSIVPQDATAGVRAFLDSLTTAELLKPETWSNPLMWSLCEVEARDDLLPVRAPYSKDGSTRAESPTLGWNRLSCEDGLTLPYLLPDLIASKLYTGRAPSIVRATLLRAEGKQELRPITILGVRVMPEDNLVQRLAEARIEEKRLKTRGWEERAAGLKTTVNSLSFGITVEINPTPETGPQEVFGIDRERGFTETEKPMEIGGAMFCPPIGAMITSGGHLLLALLDAVVLEKGGETVYCDTDSAFIAPSAIAARVATRFDSLNPYDPSSGFHVLKDETPEHSSPISFFGLSAKRYALFEWRKGRRHVLKASDHGLGAYQAPKGWSERDAFIERVWESILRAADNGEEAGEDVGRFPLTTQLTLTSPSLWPRVSHIKGMRPFNFVTIQFLLPSVNKDEEDSFRILPFIGTDDPAWVELLHDPRAKTWGDAVAAYARHRDRKYRVGPDGRIVRREVLARKNALVGIGKEGGKLEEREMLGKDANAEPAEFVDWQGRLLAMGRAEARERDQPWRKVVQWKRRVRTGKKLRKDARTRIIRALVERKPSAA